MPTDPKGRMDRKARDAWMERFYGVRRPLDEDPSQRPLHHIDRAAGPEIERSCERDLVVVATFSSSDIVLSESRRSIYTEMHLSVESVISTSRPNVKAGTVITAFEPGGTVRLPGQTIAYEVQPRVGVLQPLHRYLIYLWPLGESGAEVFGVTKAWELVGGKAMPVATEDVMRAVRGTSKYAGMDEAEFLKHVTDACREPKVIEEGW